MEPHRTINLIHTSNFVETSRCLTKITTLRKTDREQPKFLQPSIGVRYDCHVQLNQAELNVYRIRNLAETGHAQAVCNGETRGNQEANMPLLVDPQIDGFRKFPYTRANLGGLRGIRRLLRGCALQRSHVSSLHELAPSPAFLRFQNRIMSLSYVELLVVTKRRS